MAGLDFDPTVDHYKVLGVAPGASADEIKKAYRKLAKANHPDSTGGDKAKEQRFKDISNAYDVLGDQKKREQYDAIRAGGFRGPGGVAGNPFAGAGGQGVWDLGDLFSQMFSGSGDADVAPAASASSASISAGPAETSTRTSSPARARAAGVTRRPTTPTSSRG
jgi:molecular chaperone DnaJ